MNTFEATELELISANDRKAEKAFWLNQFSDVGVKSILPYDRVIETNFPNVQYAERSLVFPDYMSERILQISNKSNAKSFLILLNALHLLLARFTGQPHTTTAIPVSLQQNADALLNKTFALKYTHKEQASFKDNLISLQQCFEEAVRNQNYPIRVLLNELSHLSTSAPVDLFDIAVLMKGIHSEEYLAPFKPNVVFIFSIENNQVQVTIKYNSALYNEDSVAYYGSRLQHILTVALSDVNIPWNKIRLTSDEEERELLNADQGSAADYPLSSTLDVCWRKSVLANKEFPAVDDGTRVLTYGELNSKSESMCLTLRSLGIKQGDVIGIYLDRSVDVIVTMLGLIKLGATYLPLSSTIPVDRLTFIIQDSACKYIVTRKDLDNDSLSASEKIFIDDLSLSDAQAASDRSDLLPTDSVYMIYTSGSTGLPKGSIISHKNVINLAHGLWNEVLHADARRLNIALVSPFDFDASVQNIFTALLFGHVLKIVPDDVRKDGDKLVAFYNTKNIQVSDGTPTHLKLILASANLIKSTDMHFLIAGEVLSKSLVSQFYERYSNTNLGITNLYGPTETCVDSTWFDLSGKDLSRYRSIPIGKALPNESVYILNSEGAIQSYLMEGEIYIGGAGVSKGYHNRKELTNEKFIVHPILQNEKIYKTGDRGRRLLCGNIEFAGRNDNQVKLNGYRIELGEVEEVLKHHPWVSDAVVHVNEDGSELIGKVALREEVSQRIDSLQQKNGFRSEEEDCHVLPNGLTFHNLNANETEVVFNEVFVENTYLKNGVMLQDGDTVLDIGANAGMFTLFVGLNFPKARLFSVEPIKPIFDKLARNIAFYNLNAKPVNKGVADRSGTASFAYFPLCTTISGQFPNTGTEREVIKKFIANTRKEQKGDGEIIENVLEEVTQYQNVECELITLSQLIRENSIKKIDLLKIDVEKSELEVLKGIDEEHWKLIKQIVIEVHDTNNSLSYIQEVLKERGFNIIVEQEKMLDASSLYNIYGSKLHSVKQEFNATLDVSTLARARGHKIDFYIAALKAHMLTKLPAYMVPGLIRLVKDIPYKSNGKVDRTAVITMKGISERGEQAGPDLVSATQAQIIKEVEALLGREVTEYDADFQSIGLHSLKLMKLAYKINEEYRIKLSLQDLFQHSSIRKLSDLLDRKIYAAKPDRRIPRAERKEYYALTPGQAGLFVIQQLNKKTTAYNLPEIFSIEGEFSTKEMNEAFYKLVERHDILRTSFTLIDGVPVQVVKRIEDLDVAISLVHSDDFYSEKEVVEKFVRPFDLSMAPLMRVSIVEITNWQYLLLVDLHHIITDQVTTTLLLKELVDLYSKRNLPNQEYQFVDFVEWQHKMPMKNLEKYWKSVFENKITRLQIPYDYTVKSRKNRIGKTESFALETVWCDQLALFSEEYKVSTNSVLVSMLAIFLSRISNQCDVLLGTSVLGRTHTDFKQIAGMLMNTCVIRTQVIESDTFVEFAQDVSKTILKMIEHQDYPFEEIKRRYNDEHDGSRNPIFDVGYFFNDMDSAGDEGTQQNPGLKIERRNQAVEHARFDLTFGFSKKGNQVNYFINYDANLFKEETIHFFNRTLLDLLQVLLTNPMTPLEEANGNQNFAISASSDFEINFNIN